MTAHTPKSWGKIFNKRCETNVTRNNNFHSRRKETLNIHKENYDQKIEIHEVAKAKLSVCFLQEVRRLNNNSVIIKNKQGKQCSVKITKNSYGPAMQLEGNTELVSPLEVSYRWVPELLLLMYCCMGSTYELLVFMHLLKRTLIRQKNIFSYKLNKQFRMRKQIICLEDFNASSSMPPRQCLLVNASSSMPPRQCLLVNASSSMPPRQLLGIIRLFEKIRQKIF